MDLLKELARGAKERRKDLLKEAKRLVFKKDGKVYCDWEKLKELEEKSYYQRGFDQKEVMKIRNIMFRYAKKSQTLIYSKEGAYFPMKDEKNLSPLDINFFNNNFLESEEAKRYADVFHPDYTWICRIQEMNPKFKK